MTIKIDLNEIKTLLTDGQTYTEVANRYGCSRQYIEQLRKKHFPDLGRKDVGVSRRKIINRNKQKESWGRDEWYLEDLERAQNLKFFRKRQNSARQGYEWSLELADVTFPSHCPILGLELDYFAEATKENSPSFDRFDSNIGYVKGNVHIISWRANRIKNNGTAEEHRKIAEYIDKMTKECQSYHCNATVFVVYYM